jgi:hypothetical protein
MSFESERPHQPTRNNYIGSEASFEDLMRDEFEFFVAFGDHGDDDSPVGSPCKTAPSPAPLRLSPAVALAPEQALFSPSETPRGSPPPLVEEGTTPQRGALRRLTSLTAPLHAAPCAAGATRKRPSKPSSPRVCLAPLSCASVARAASSAEQGRARPCNGNDPPTPVTQGPRGQRLMVRLKPLRSGSLER